MGYADLTNSFKYKSPLLRSLFDALGENDLFLKNHAWQDGSKIVFFQAAVPTGWTLATYTNDNWLRVVSGIGGGQGGQHHASQTILFNHTHTLVAAPNHTHAATMHWHDLDRFSNAFSLFDMTEIKVTGVGDVDLVWAPQHGSAAGMQNRSRLDALNVPGASSAAGGHNHTATATGFNYSLSYADTIIGVKSADTGYTDMTDYFTTGQKFDFEPFQDALRNNDEFIKRRQLFGSTVPFAQSSAPQGWQSAGAPYNGAGLRTTGSGGGGYNGTIIGSTMYFSHSHAISFAATHVHNAPAHSHQFQEFSEPGYDGSGGYVGASGGAMVILDGGINSTTVYRGRTATDGGGATTGPDFSHTHDDTTINLFNVQLAYLDVKLCTKISTGSPASWFDLNGVAAFKKLVSRQRLKKFADNDAYNRYHGYVPGMKTFFYQPTPPIHWTQDVLINDKFLRMVNSGGSVGGTKPLSESLNLHHTHALSTVNHQHTIPSHTHTVESRTYTGGSPRSSGAGLYYVSTDVGSIPGKIGDKFMYASTDQGFGVLPGRGFPAKPTTAPTQQAATTDIASHTHATDDQGTNYNFAYTDVILCQKDA